MVFQPFPKLAESHVPKVSGFNWPCRVEVPDLSFGTGTGAANVR
jgi:hypothetical protein